MKNHIIPTSRCSPDERTNPLHRSLINIFIRNETQDSTRHLPLGGGGGSLIINNSSPYIIKFRANDIIHLIYTLLFPIRIDIHQYFRWKYSLATNFRNKEEMNTST